MTLSSHYIDCPARSLPTADCLCVQRAAQHLDLLQKASRRSVGRLAYIRVAKPVTLSEDEHGQAVEGCKGGVRKIILTPGTGECPPFGATVTVTSEAFILPQRQALLGTTKPQKFKIGRNCVISGWDRGVESMRKGEVAILTCSPEWAYGSRGREPDVPPNATLQYKITLLDWDNWMKATEDSGVMKRVIEAGEEPHRPNEFASCVVQFKGWAENGHVFADNLEGEPVTIQLDTDPLNVQGFESALMNMYVHEHSEFQIRPEYAFGEEAKPEWQIGPNETVYYEIKLLSFEKGRETWQMSVDERIEFMDQKKLMGNAYFKIGKIQRAAKMYQSAIKVFQFTDHLTPEQKSQVTALKVSCNSNLASCTLKSKEPLAPEFRSKVVPLPREQSIIRYCTEALQMDPHHMKSLIMRARMNAILMEDALAQADLVLALKLEPGHPEAVKISRVVCQRLLKAKEKEKNLFKGMFDALDIAKEMETANPKLDARTKKAQDVAALEGAMVALERLKKRAEEQKAAGEAEEEPENADPSTTESTTAEASSSNPEALASIAEGNEEEGETNPLKIVVTDHSRLVRRR